MCILKFYKKMAAEGVKKLGDGVSLKSWIKLNYLYIVMILFKTLYAA